MVIHIQHEPGNGYRVIRNWLIALGPTFHAFESALTHARLLQAENPEALLRYRDPDAPTIWTEQLVAAPGEPSDG